MKGMRVMKGSVRNISRGIRGVGGGLIMLSLPWEFMIVRNCTKEKLYQSRSSSRWDFHLHSYVLTIYVRLY